MDLRGKNVIWVTNREFATRKTRAALLEKYGGEIMVVGEATEVLNLLKTKPALVVVELDCVDYGTNEFWIRNRLHVVRQSKFPLGPLLCHLIKKAEPNLPVIAFGILYTDWNVDLNQVLTETLPDEPWDRFLGPVPTLENFQQVLSEL